MTGVSVEAVEEFKVQSGAYSSEFGRTSNGIINWVTKSGTNELHGSGFLFLRNEFFNARGYTFTAAQRPVRRQWNPGLSVGGPICAVRWLSDEPATAASSAALSAVREHRW